MNCMTGKSGFHVTESQKKHRCTWKHEKMFRPDRPSTLTCAWKNSSWRETRWTKFPQVFKFRPIYNHHEMFSSSEIIIHHLLSQIKANKLKMRRRINLHQWHWFSSLINAEMPAGMRHLTVHWSCQNPLLASESLLFPRAPEVLPLNLKRTGGFFSVYTWRHTGCSLRDFSFSTSSSAGRNEESGSASAPQASHFNEDYHHVLTKWVLINNPTINASKDGRNKWNKQRL